MTCKSLPPFPAFLPPCSCTWCSWRPWRCSPSSTPKAFSLRLPALLPPATSEPQSAPCSDVAGRCGRHSPQSHGVHIGSAHVSCSPPTQKNAGQEGFTIKPIEVSYPFKIDLERLAKYIVVCQIDSTVDKFGQVCQPGYRDYGCRSQPACLLCAGPNALSGGHVHRIRAA